MRGRTLTAALLACAALALTGCTPGTPRTAVIDRATPAPVPTLTQPTPTVSPVVESSPDPAAESADTPTSDTGAPSSPATGSAGSPAARPPSVPAEEADEPVGTTSAPTTQPRATAEDPGPATSAPVAPTGPTQPTQSVPLQRSAPRPSAPAAPTSSGPTASTPPTPTATSTPPTPTPTSTPTTPAAALVPTRAALTVVGDDEIANVTREATAWYKTSGPTRFYADSDSGPQEVVIPRQYVLGARDAVVEGSRVRVDYRGVSGWVDLSDVAQVDQTTIGATLDSYTDQEYAEVLQSQVAAFCPDVRYDVSASSERAGQYNAAHSAVFTTANGVKTATSDIVINFGRRDLPDPEFALVRSINSHECAHVVQYRVYPPDPETGELSGGLAATTEKYWGGVDKPGEHFTDCIADQMGVLRHGESWNTAGGWISGYGGTCSATQSDVARRVLGGEKVT